MQRNAICTNAVDTQDFYDAQIQLILLLKNTNI